jgi:hypothetical protein
MSSVRSHKLPATASIASTAAGLLGALFTLYAAACSSDPPPPIGTPDGSIIFGADAPIIRVDAPVFDAPIIDARPPPDASPVFDASPFDAPIGDRFDVAYVNEWKLNAGATGLFTVDDLAVFINTGSTNLNMRNAQILSVTDDSGNADFHYELNSPDEDRVISPGIAYGANGNVNVAPLITPLVPEPHDPRTAVVVTGGFSARPGGSTVHPKVMIQIGDAVAELDFLIHVTGGGGDAVEFVNATRVISAFPPDAGVSN